MDHDNMEALSDAGSLMGDLLEPLDGDLLQPGANDVDDLLDVLAREVDDNNIGQDFSGIGNSSHASLDLDPNTLEAISDSLQESLAKFDDFLERTNANGPGEEQDDELTELRPIESLREKRNWNHGLDDDNSADPRFPSTGSALTRRIRNISGEKLSSMPAMHHGYATTSSLNKNTFNSGNAPQKNQTWDKPEPVLGEVTGHKMRRLLSDRSYFQSRPATSDASKNAPWNQPKATPTVSARTAMQTLLHGSPHVPSQTAQPASGTQSSGWPTQKPAQGGITLAQMQQFASTTPSFPSQAASNPFQNNLQSTGVAQGTGIPQNAGVSAQKPAFAAVSLQDMQRLASTGAFAAQAAPAGAGNTSQGVAQAQTASWSAQKPMFAAVSLQDMQRLAISGVSAPAQTVPAAASSNATQTTVQNGGFVAPAPKPAFASVSFDDMQRLAASGVATVPVQAPAAASTNANQNSAMPPPPPNPVFAAVSLQDMQRLANSGVAFPMQAAPAASVNTTQNVAQAPTPPWAAAKPAFAAVSLQEMQRLAATGAAFPAQTATTTSASGVPSPPWATTASKPAAQTANTAQGLQGLGNSGAPNQMGITSQSFGNISQATAAPKPAFATVSVSLEDMQRLASTGVSRPIAAPSVPAPASFATQNAPWNAPKSSAGSASMGSVQRSTNASTALPSQASSAASDNVAASQRKAPKPTFASVTLDDMQRLVNAYSDHQTPRTEPPSGTQPATFKPTPAAESADEMQRAADGTGSISQGHSSESESVTQSMVCNSTDAVNENEDARKNISLASDGSASMPNNGNVICADSATPPKRVSGGAIQQMLSAESKSSESANALWPDAISSKDADKDSEGSQTPPDEHKLPSDPDEMLQRLRSLMDRTSSTQQALQDFDKKRGLPRSHSQTMVNSSRSRKQLLEGKIIAKWDGSPLISDEHELGKPKPRGSTNKSTGDLNKKSGTDDNMDVSVQNVPFAAV